MRVVIVCSRVIVIFRTRKNIPWRNIYMDSTPKSKRARRSFRSLFRPASNYTLVNFSFTIGHGRSRVFGRSGWPCGCRPTLLAVRISSPNQLVSSLIRLPLLAVISDQERPRW